MATEAKRGCNCYAIATNPERQEMWKRIFPPDGKVPLKHPLVAGRATTEGHGEYEFYEMDLSRVTPEERLQLIREIATKFHIPEDEVQQDLDKEGVPVKASDVIVSWCQMHMMAAL